MFNCHLDHVWGIVRQHPASFAPDAILSQDGVKLFGDGGPRVALIEGFTGYENDINFKNTLQINKYLPIFTAISFLLLLWTKLKVTPDYEEL